MGKDHTKRQVSDISGKRDPRVGLPAVKQSIKIMDSVYGTIPENIVLPDQKWDELDENYNAAATAIYTVASELDGMVKIPGLVERLEKPKEFNIALAAINSDLLNFTEELVNIKKQHEGKTGPITASNDLAQCLQIAGDYMTFTTRFTAVTTPAVLSLGEQLDAARLQLEQNTPQQPAAEPAPVAVPAEEAVQQ